MTKYYWVKYRTDTVEEEEIIYNNHPLIYLSDMKRENEENYGEYNYVNEIIMINWKEVDEDVYNYFLQNELN